MSLEKIGPVTQQASSVGENLYPSVNLPNKLSGGSTMTCDGNKISTYWTESLPLGTWSSGNRLHVRVYDLGTLAQVNSGGWTEGEDQGMNIQSAINGKIYYRRNGGDSYSTDWADTVACMNGNNNRLRYTRASYDTAQTKDVDGHYHNGESVGIITQQNDESDDVNGNTQVIMSGGSNHNLHDTGSGDPWEWGGMQAVTNGETTITWYFQGDRGGTTEAIAVEHGTTNVKWRSTNSKHTGLRPTASHFALLNDDEFLARNNNKWKCVKFDTGNIKWSVNPSVSTNINMKIDQTTGNFFYKDGGRVVRRSSSDGSIQGRYDDPAGIGGFCAGSGYLFYLRTQKPKPEINRVAVENVN